MLKLIERKSDPSASLQPDLERLNRRLRSCLQHALLVKRRGLEPLAFRSWELGIPEVQWRYWLENPIQAPLDWLLSVARAVDAENHLQDILETYFTGERGSELFAKTTPETQLTRNTGEPFDSVQALDRCQKAK